MVYDEKEIGLYVDYINFTKRIIIDLQKERGNDLQLWNLEFTSIKKDLCKVGDKWTFYWSHTDGDEMVMCEGLSGRYSGISFHKYVQLRKRDDRNKKIEDLLK